MAMQTKFFIDQEIFNLRQYICNCLTMSLFFSPEAEHIWLSPFVCQSIYSSNFLVWTIIQKFQLIHWSIWRMLVDGDKTECCLQNSLLFLVFSSTGCNWTYRPDELMSWCPSSVNNYLWMRYSLQFWLYLNQTCTVKYSLWTQ